MPRLAEPPLESFLAGLGCEFEDASRRDHVVDHCLRFGSCGVRLRVAGPALAEVLLPALARARVEELGAVDATVVSWSQGAGPERPVPWPWHEGEIGPGGLVRGSQLAGVAVVHETYSDAVTVVDWAERVVLCRVPACDAIPWWERAAPLRVALSWALRGPSRHLVHAGAVGDDRGVVVLAGARGSGKTTVALAALADGLQYLGDDYVLLDGAGEATVSPVYNTASVRPAAGSEEKAVLDLAEMMPGYPRGSLPIRAVIVARVRGGRARLRCVSPAEALRAWAPATALHLPFDHGSVVATLAHVVRRVPCFGLDVGDDAAELAGAVGKALERVAR